MFGSKSISKMNKNIKKLLHYNLKCQKMTTLEHRHLQKSNQFYEII